MSRAVYGDIHAAITMVSSCTPRATWAITGTRIAAAVSATPRVETEDSVYGDISLHTHGMQAEQEANRD